LARYFNAGVLVIDLEAWRAQGIGDRLRSAMSRLDGKFGFGDQDALNFVLIDNWVELPIEWDYLFVGLPGAVTPVVGSRILASDGIVHFVGPIKPWHDSFPEGPFLKMFTKAADESGWHFRERVTAPCLP